MNHPIRSIVLIGITIIVLSVGWYFYYSMYTFHIVKTTPGTSDIATLTPSMTITLNKEITSIETVDSSPSFDYIESYSFSGKEIHISFSDLHEKKTVSVLLKNIKSIDNHTLNKTVSFTPTLKDADELPEAQLKELLEKQDRETNENADPIQAVIPYSTLNYALSLTLLGQKETGGNKYGIDARIILSQADVNIDEAGAINKYKQDIHNYLTSHNINPDDYLISYNIEKP